MPKSWMRATPRYTRSPKWGITDHTNVEQCLLVDANAPVADKWRDRSTLHRVVRKLVVGYGEVDVRSDTTKHIRKDFGRLFVEAKLSEIIESELDHLTYNPPYRTSNTPSCVSSKLEDMVKAAQSSYRLDEFMTRSFRENQSHCWPSAA
ncbi:glycoside hydrolase family 13 protein [Wolfiporia cocos MD-104 SS10]|uniref:Glycoside hydrolase family 13 protein n=1 Tax=Wolfiporia cocos (strain MD-104) TaxID=742152 RepID=A0A2H3JVA4_WOLCO|nr:glycoside hydrolase family 13 protein [Wolfiporia cocos MD-104 SS10]